MKHFGSGTACFSEWQHKLVIMPATFFDNDDIKQIEDFQKGKKDLKLEQDSRDDDGQKIET